MTSSPLSVIILAAGKGTRMKSDKAKVLHEVFYAPMIHHVINSTLPLLPLQTIVIVGHQKSAVEQALTAFDLNFVVQNEQLGTGHAVLVAETATSENSDTVMILCGDTPLVKEHTLQEMYWYHREKLSALTLMTTILQDPTNYGRIICDKDDNVLGIVEQKDATEEELKIQEINAGIYCVDKTFLFKALKKVGTDNSQGEIYLTDIVKLAVESGLIVDKYITKTPLDVLGVNSRIELATAQSELQMRRNKMLMLEGVSMNQPETISVCPESVVEKDTSLDSNVKISNSCRIGHSCRIEQGCILKNCQIGANSTIGPYSCLTNCNVPPNTIMSPFSKSF